MIVYRKGETMDFFELIEKRYSVRAYLPEAVEEEKLQKILQAARLAPTAANRQPFQIIVAHTRGREGELGRLYGRPWFTQAPLVICVCALPGKAWVRKLDSFNAAVVDAAIVMDHIVLAATALGLGTCWIAHFDPEAARQVLELPEGMQALLLTPLGYPADTPPPRQRKELSELVRYEKWE
jgi:nitroreductase